MEHLFILGRNPQLSVAEILSVMERDKVEIKNKKLNSNGILIETDKELDEKELINNLGGTIAIGQVLFSGKEQAVLKKIAESVLYNEEENKMSYTVLDFSKDEFYQDALEAVKENFRNDKLKALFRNASGAIISQEHETFHGSPGKIRRLDKIYFLFKDKEYKFGIIDHIYDSREDEKRDMKKPVRREELAISPRLAKILINLSQVKKKETLVDPFCGIGVILQEALIQNINVIGIDSSAEALEGARKNIEWLKGSRKLAGYKFIGQDSSNATPARFDGIATEPELGILLKHVPRKEEAQETVRKFESLLIQVLRNMKRYMKRDGKIVFTSPLIKTSEGRVSCDITRISQESGLVLKQFPEVIFPLSETREGKIVSREIYVLEQS